MLSACGAVLLPSARTTGLCIVALCAVERPICVDASGSCVTATVVIEALINILARLTSFDPWSIDTVIDMQFQLPPSIAQALVLVIIGAMPLHGSAVAWAH
jgi:hypothetical protein